MKSLVGIWFVIVCCMFGTGLLIFDSIQRGEKTSPCRTPSQCSFETWIDEATGNRFIIVVPRWKDGVGICLIPEREAENDCPAPALAEKVILESTVGWKEIQ